MDVLAPKVVLITDGGGVRRAALRPIRGVDKVLRFILGVTPRDGGFALEVAQVNGGTGLRILAEGLIDAVATVHVVDGRVTELYLVRNPHTLARITQETPLTR